MKKIVEEISGEGLEKLLGERVTFAQSTQVLDWEKKEAGR
jgi:hypothetical protein